MAFPAECPRMHSRARKSRSSPSALAETCRGVEHIRNKAAEVGRSTGPALGAVRPGPELLTVAPPSGPLGSWGPSPWAASGMVGTPVLHCRLTGSPLWWDPSPQCVPLEQVWKPLPSSPGHEGRGPCTIRPTTSGFALGAEV